MRGDHRPYPDDPEDSDLPSGPIEQYMDSPELLDPVVGARMLDIIDEGYDVIVITTVRHDRLYPDQQLALTTQVSARLEDRIVDELPEMVEQVTRSQLAYLHKKLPRIAALAGALAGMGADLLWHWLTAG